MTKILIIKCDDCYDLPYTIPFISNLEQAFSDLSMTFLTFERNRDRFNQLISNKNHKQEFLFFRERDLKKLFEYSRGFWKKKFDYIFILDDSVTSIFLSRIFSSRHRVTFKRNLLIDCFTNVNVERNTLEYKCDQYNYMLQKAEIRTPVRNPGKIDFFLDSLKIKSLIPENYILFICKNFVIELSWITELINELKIPLLCLEINHDCDNNILKIFDQEKSEFTSEDLNEGVTLDLISRADCIFSKDTKLYSLFSLYANKAVFISKRNDAIKWLFRIFNHHYVDCDDKMRLLTLLNGEHSEQSFFDFREESTRNFKNILVLKTGGLGDLILSYPTISLIRKAWPNARITALIIPYMLQLAKYNKDFDEVIAYDKQKKKDFRYIFEVGKQLKNKKFDAFFLLNRSPRVVLLSLLSGIKDVIAYGTKAMKPFIRHRIFEKDRHSYKVLLQNIDIARGLGIDVDEVRYGDYEVEESPRIGKFIDTHRKDRKLIMINIGGRWPSKKFKPSKWSSLIDALIIKYKKPVFLLWGPDEMEIVEDVFNGVKDKTSVFILPTTNMGEVAYSIGRSMLFITCDTGAMHIADAMKVPQVVLMGPTSPVRWGSISPQSKIIYKKVPCGPCNTEVCSDHDNICMAQIKPSDILLEINEMELEW